MTTGERSLDWRIRLQDGGEVNLSRRYRQRFEAAVPVRS